MSTPRIPGLAKKRYDRKRKADLIKKGVCWCCAKAPAHENLQRCLPCQEAARASARRYANKQRAIWRSLHICTRCGQREACKDRRWCGRCAEEHGEYMNQCNFIKRKNRRRELE